MYRRFFLTAAGALALAPAAQAAQAGRARLDAEIVRTAPDKVRLTWSGAPRVQVRVAATPEAMPGAMRRLADVAGGGADLVAPTAPRPYFLVSGPDGRSVRVAERLLPLEGGRNFRDLGGWRVADGRQVRWGQVYRSGVMAGLTLADMTYLSKLGIKVICDLRNPQERTSEPNPYLKSGNAQVIASDYDMSASMASFARMSSREDAIQGFAEAYVGFLDMLTPHYTDMFERLVVSEAPLAFNCSAGKDRTGMAAALILSVLGAPRETVIKDYSLTEVYTPPAFYMKQAAQGGAGSSMTPAQAEAFRKMSPEALKVIMGSDPEVMRRALAMIDAKHGGPIALTKARFGLTDAKIDRLRRRLLV